MLKGSRRTVDRNGFFSNAFVSFDQNYIAAVHLAAVVIAYVK
jgi:hypothetical protein